MNFKKLVKKSAIVILILSVFIFANNTSLLTKERKGDPFLLAHRGMAQTFSMHGIEGDTCTAERIYEPEHTYLENTLPSIEAAFKEGADMVEFDIRPTKDGEFAVFHDWTLDCRTNLTGEPKEYTMEQLKKADIGYGYTADGGKTYPFRGEGVGLMPSLKEVLSTFPGKLFLIHIKSNDREEGSLLAEKILQLSDSQRDLITVYGGDAPIQSLKKVLPDIRVMSKETLKGCLIPYLSYGWSGAVPDDCTETQLHIPQKYVRLLWGWPDKFLNRMEAVETRVIIVAGDGTWSEGFDSEKDLETLPSNYTGGLWTNRIDKIAPIFK
ncbi:glycerophosphodiester phosphodiesterase [Bacillus salacetis]|uniref:Glycerophosphodiester phosphodiesterase n=1 Tax=Bacillus salacetis TaxID=2315464 RepID=A0A3A1RA57_9BACI|nr:glycerophosphodiester phosphodiesterase family protein [Bacillus salacetis]RIW38794.1 glycerophosphodiester phosphodiesterase [Bacillus salacetis]